LFVEMEGECENSAGVLVPLNQFKCNSDIQFSLDYAEADCVSRPEFNCLDASPGTPSGSSQSGQAGQGGGQGSGSGGKKQPIVSDKNNVDSSKNKENKHSTRLPSSVESGSPSTLVSRLTVVVLSAVVASSSSLFSSSLLHQ
jgi:hypothetical protein